MPSQPHSFPYLDGSLQCEGVPLAAIAAEIGTPFYCYSAEAMRRQYRIFADAFAGDEIRICYAVKANSNQAVLSLFARLGAGADIVSEGELRRALAAGIPAERVVFSGVAKTEAELRFALAADVGQINIESEVELDLLARLVAGRDRPVRVAFRVNPDVDAKTHPKIATGKAENKFGIAIGEVPRLFARAALMPGLDPATVAVHIGSQLMELGPYEAAFGRVAELVRDLRAGGIPIRHLDLGGGLGVPYRGETPPNPADYASLVRRILGPLECGLTFEPGRFLVAEAGVLVSRVIALKPGQARTLLLQDAAMNDLIRPTLYEAYHPILPVREADPAAVLSAADIVGPVCESGDYLAAARPMPKVAAGELLAVMYAGAYGAVMSSTYNTRRLAPEVMVDGTRWAVVRPRQSYEDLIGLDRVPDWLRPGAAS